MRCSAPVSDQQTALGPAGASVFPHAKHGLCQVHYFKNAAEPVADAVAEPFITKDQMFTLAQYFFMALALVTRTFCLSFSSSRHTIYRKMSFWVSLK